MKGLKKAIKDQLPSTWEHILRKNKALGKFIDYFYKSIPEDKKGNRITCGKKAWRKGIEYIRFKMNNYPLSRCFDEKYKNLDYGKIDWNKIQSELNEYENSLR